MEWMPDKGLDTAILAAIRDGARTAHVASRLGALHRRRDIYRHLKKMEARGLVRRNDNYSYVNSIYWEAGQ